MSVLYKIIAKEGFNVIEFTFFRCISALLVSSVWNAIVKVNPFGLFPWERKGTLALRSVMGHLSFTLINLAVPLAPLTLIMVVFQTNPFWITLIAFCILREPIVHFEFIGILLCFGAVILIAF